MADDSEGAKRPEIQSKKQTKQRRPVTHTDLSVMWDDVLANDMNCASLEFGFVGEHRNIINSLTGWSVNEDTVIAVHGDEVIHIRKNHGTAGVDKKGRPIGEVRSGQLPVEKSDFASIPQIFESPTFSTATDPHWGLVLMATANINGHLTVVTVFATSKNMLRVLSLRKYP